MRSAMKSLLFCPILVFMHLAASGEANAGCAPAATAGDDTITCSAALPPNPTPGLVDLLAGNDRITVESGTYSGGINGNLGNDTIILLDGVVAFVNDTAGNNTLILGPGGNPAVTGGVVFGTGRDRMEVHSGVVNGAISQGDGVDTFIMTGGQVLSIDQGGGLDTAVISGGVILGVFDNGDFVTITGGTIGSVDLNVANNVFEMSGGLILGDVTAEQGGDSFTLSGGVIQGMVDLGNGNNILTVTGGQIGSGIVTGTGADQLTWSGGGTIAGPINLGAGNDAATLINLTSTILSATTLLDGGDGSDTLTFDGTEATGVARFTNWETIALTNSSRLTLDTSLVLGDNGGTQIGTLTIDPTSTVLSGNGSNPSIRSVTPGTLVSVVNAGIIDLANGIAGATDTLTILGNYIGNGGTLRIQSVLAGDTSPADRLNIDSGMASGTTGIVVINLGGPGAMTTGNGIAIVVAQNGGTTAAGAFHLAGPAAAGPFQYLLFQGPPSGGTTDEQNSWYLRSHTTATATGAGPALPPGGGGGNGGGGGGGGGGDGGGVPIPLYRPETASYALFPALARSLAVSSIGSFHERNGDQALAAGSKRERMWGRVFGEHSERSHGGHVTPSFEGHAAGFQAGADVYETVWDNGVRGRTGIFVGWAEARGDIKGFVLGNLQAFAGDAQLEATSVGGYGTLVGPGGWYLDGIVMPSFYSGDGRSTNGIGVNADGWSLLGSLEAGMPFRIGGGFTLEPQAQLIYQHLSFDDAADPFSTVRFNTPDAVSGRIGVRLAGTFADGRLRPYLKANLWQDWLDKDGVIYAGTHRLDTEHGGTALEVGGGLVAELMPGVGLWGVVDYTTDIAGDTERETLRGNAGVRITW